MGKADHKRLIKSIRSQKSSAIQYHTITESVLGESETHKNTKAEEQEEDFFDSDEESDDNVFIRTDITVPSESYISVGKQNKEEQQIPDIEGDPRCPWRPTDSRTLPSLEEDIALFVSWMKPRMEEKYARQSFVKQVFDIIYKVCGPTCKPTIFGSFVTGLYLPTSDIDVVILNSEREKPISRLAKELRKQPFITNMTVISKARVPLIKFEHAQTKIQMDISFDLDNGPRNTAIVKSLLREFAVAKPLMILIKYILKQKQLNEVYTGGIGSYALFLMIISFLQQTDVRLEDAKLSSLLIDFCELYGCEFNYYSVGISVANEGYFSKEQRGWVNDNQACLLSIEDPQDYTNDVSKSSFNIMSVRNTLNSTFRILSSARTAPALLDTIFNIDSELLQYRLNVQKLFANKIPDDEIKLLSQPSSYTFEPVQIPERQQSKEKKKSKRKQNKKPRERRHSDSYTSNDNFGQGKRTNRPWRHSPRGEKRKRARYS